MQEKNFREVISKTNNVAPLPFIESFLITVKLIRILIDYFIN